MIRELINFTNNLSEDFKNEAYKPSPGLHVLVKTQGNSCVIHDFLYYNGIDELNETLRRILSYELRSSYISMNQQQKFDKKQKIHSSSPFSFAFNFSLGNNKKDIEIDIKQNIEQETHLKFNDKTLNSEQKKELERLLDSKVKSLKIDLVKDSIENYFSNAKRLCLDEISQELTDKLATFENFCKDLFWQELGNMKMKINISKKKNMEEWDDVTVLSELKEKEYVRLYLTDIALDEWDKAYTKYYEGEYPPNDLSDNDFISTFPDKKPFMSHQTASFDTVKISGKEAKVLKVFKEILSVKPKVIPNPVPIFIYEDELLQNKVIALFNDKEKSCGYKEMIENLWSDHKDQLSNYYLIDWYVGKDIVFQDFEFVPKFEFELDAEIHNLFAIKEKGSKGADQKLLHYPRIKNVFEFENRVFHSLLQNKFLKVDYFGELNKDNYEDLNNTFQSFSKYRKAVYDFVYKSKRHSIDNRIFSDMVFSRLKDDIKNNNEYGIKEKLNIWFSLYEIFNNNKINTIKTMASKLKDYQDFVAKLAVGEAKTDEATDAQFAFAAGQVIEYVIQKSKTDNKSYQLLEPYLQQAKCNEFKKALANDISRYKHAIYDNEHRFKNVCALVFSWDTDKNMKEFLPEILAGVFARNEFFTIKMDKTEIQLNNSQINN